jgi:hypothetical protein
MESENVKASEKTDEVLQYFKNTRARKLVLPAAYASRMDVMEAVSNNRAITTLDVSECEVCTHHHFSICLLPQCSVFMPSFHS